MKNTGRKLAALLLSAVLSLTLLAGCGETRSVQTAPNEPETQEQETVSVPEAQEQTEEQAEEQTGKEAEAIKSSAEAAGESPVSENGEPEDAAEPESGEDEAGTSPEEPSGSLSEEEAVETAEGDSDIQEETSEDGQDTVSAEEAEPGDVIGYDRFGDRIYKDGPGVVTSLDGTELRVCIFGDSQFDHYRGADGISALVSKYCHADVFNCAVGGSTASMWKGDSLYEENWDSFSLYGLSRAAVGEVDPGYLSRNEEAYQNFQSCNMDMVDVFIIAYGINDFLEERPIANDYLEDKYTYGGSLNSSVKLLMDHYPNAQYILVTPAYAVFFEGERYLGDGNIYDKGYGTLTEYVAAEIRVAKEYGIDYIDAYQWLGIWSGNYWEWLEDGIHLNSTARRKLAQMIARVILRHNGYNVPTETNLDTLDYSTLERTKNGNQ